MILLVNPPAQASNPILPLGLAYIASHLSVNEVPVKVLDAWAEGLDIKKTVSHIISIDPDYTGITAMSPRWHEVKKMVEQLRALGYKKKIILGGPHPSALPEQTLKELPVVDYIVIGEGEETLLELVRALDDKSDVSKIRGIAYLDENKVFKLNDPRPNILEINNLAEPARHLFPVEKYKTHPPYGRKNPYMNMITSRGCPFSCNYCSKSVFGKTYRALNPKRVADEIEGLIEKYFVREIHFYDDDFTLDMKRAEKICDEIILRDLKVIWSCTTRVDLINKELLSKMKKAGCWMIAYGVESGSQKIINSINKGVNLNQIKETFLLTRNAGIKTLGYFMMGFPGETLDDIIETIKLSQELKADFASWSILYAFPGTPFYKMLLENLEKKGQNLYYLEEKDRVVTPYGTGNFYIFEDNFTADQLWHLAKMANKKFYLRPSYIANCLSNIKSIQDLSLYISGGMTLVKTILGK